LLCSTIRLNLVFNLIAAFSELSDGLLVRLLVVGVSEHSDNVKVYVVYVSQYYFQLIDEHFFPLLTPFTWE